MYISDTSSSSVQLLSTVELSAIAANASPDNYMFMATLKAPHYKAEKRSPLDLVAVVDR